MLRWKPIAVVAGALGAIGLVFLARKHYSDRQQFYGPGGKPNLTAGERAEILDLMTRTPTPPVKVIAAQYGVTGSAIRKLLERYILHGEKAITACPGKGRKPASDVPWAAEQVMQEFIAKRQGRSAAPIDPADIDWDLLEAEAAAEIPEAAAKVPKAAEARTSARKGQRAIKNEAIVALVDQRRAAAHAAKLEAIRAAREEEREEREAAREERIREGRQFVRTGKQSSAWIYSTSPEGVVFPGKKPRDLKGRSGRLPRKSN